MKRSLTLFDKAREATTPPYPYSIDDLLQMAGECRTCGWTVTENIFLEEAARRRFRVGRQYPDWARRNDFEPEEY